VGGGSRQCGRKSGADRRAESDIWNACRWHWIGNLVKGHSGTIVEDRKVDWERMRRHHISEADLMEDLRLSGVESVADVKLARLERSGQISVVRQCDRGKRPNAE